MKAKRVAGLLLAGLATFSLASCKKQATWAGMGPGAAVSSPTTFAKTYSLETISDQTKVDEKISLLEKYALENRIYGYVYAVSSNFTSYNLERHLFPLPDKDGKPDYLIGYGMGASTEGRIKGAGLKDKADTEGYMASTEDTTNISAATINYFDNRGAVAGSYFGSTHASYFNQRLRWNKESKKIEKEYFGTLADETVMRKNNVEEKEDNKVRPIALNDAGQIDKTYKSGKTASKWRVYVKTTKKYPNLKYTIKDESYKQGDGSRLDIKLEDYLTSFKYLELGSAPVERSLSNKGQSSELKGTFEYYQATKSESEAIKAGTTQDQVKKINEIFAKEFGGVKVGVDNEGNEYLDFEFNKAITSFYAMYYLNSSLYTPIPQEFIMHIGGLKNYGTRAGGKKKIQETIVQTGAFVLRDWNINDNYIILDRNEITTGQNGIFGKNRLYEVQQDPSSGYKPSAWGKLQGELPEYRYNGVKGAVYKGVDSSKDVEVSWKLFNSGEIDDCAIPQTQVSAHKGDANAIQLEGVATTKLNVNTTTEEEWEYMFGKNGVVNQSTKKREHKPILSNKNFIKALDFLMPRKEVAESNGQLPSAEYFAKAYISDAEKDLNGAYNDSVSHKNVLKAFYGTDYDTIMRGEQAKTTATDLLKKALAELTEGENAAYQAGATIKLEMLASSKLAEDNITKKIAEKLSADINQVFGSKLKVEFELWHPTGSYLEMYERLQAGHYDFALGGITGSALDPLGLLDILKSKNSKGFCLNFSHDTNKVYLDKEGKLDPQRYIDITKLIEGDQKKQDMPKYWSFDGFWDLTQGSKLAKVEEIAGSKVGVTSDLVKAERLTNIITYDKKGENAKGRNGAVILLNVATINSDPEKTLDAEKHIMKLASEGITYTVKAAGSKEAEDCGVAKYLSLSEYDPAKRPDFLPGFVNIDAIKAKDVVKNVAANTDVILIFISGEEMNKHAFKTAKFQLLFNYEFTTKEGELDSKQVKEYVIESFL